MPLRAKDASGVGYGAIGGAASAAFSPDFIKAIDPTGAALDPGQQAALAVFATLLGGVTAGLAGQNAQAGALAAQNEALNNSGAPSDVKNSADKGGLLSQFGSFLSSLGNDALDQLASAGRGAVNMGNQFVGLMNANSGQTPPSDPNPLVDANNGNNTPSGTAGAIVTPPVAVPLPNGTIATTPPLIAPGSPILSSGNGDNTGSSQSPAASNEPATSSTYDTSITSPGSKYPNGRTDVTASQFQANLIANGYSVQNQGTSTNGAFTVLSNGTSTYTIYTRTSTGAAGVQYIGPNGAVKFSLGGH